MSAEEFDQLLPIPKYSLVKVTGKNKLFILGPQDDNIAFQIEGYIAEVYKTLDGLKNLGQFVDEAQRKKKISKTEARILIKDVFTELSINGLIDFSQGKDEKNKKNR